MPHHSGLHHGSHHHGTGGSATIKHHHHSHIHSTHHHSLGGGATVNQPSFQPVTNPPRIVFPPSHLHSNASHHHHFRHHDHHPHSHHPPQHHFHHHRMRGPDVFVVEVQSDPRIHEPYAYSGVQTVSNGYTQTTYSNSGSSITYFERPNMLSECDCTDWICVQDGNVLCGYKVGSVIVFMLGIILMIAALGNSGMMAAGVVLLILGLIALISANGFHNCAYNKYGRVKKIELLNKSLNLTEQDLEAVKNPVLPNVDLDTTRPFSTKQADNVFIVSDAEGSGLNSSGSSVVVASAPPLSEFVVPASYSPLPTASASLPYPHGVQVLPSEGNATQTLRSVDDCSEDLISVYVTEE